MLGYIGNKLLLFQAIRDILHENEREDMPITACFSLLFRCCCVVKWVDDVTAKTAVAIFAGTQVCCSSNGGLIFYVFAALFLWNNVVKFEKITLIRIV